MSFDGWKEVKLEEIIDITMGQSPKSEYYNSTGEGLPFLQGNRTFGEKTPYFDTYCTENKKIAEKNDVIMSVRAPVGDLNIAPTTISIGRGVCAMRLRNSNDNNYLYYLMTHNINRMINRESGTVFGSVNKRDILGLKITTTDNKSEQKAIANILSTLDEKIEVNNQINETLENMAQELFKRWFVDFEFPNEEGEPYQLSGGEMVESELGMMPKGWRVGTISDYIDTIIGGDWGKANKENNYTEKVYCIRGADLKEINVGNKGKAPERYILEKNLLKKKLHAGNLIIEISGGSPTQSTGRIGYVSKEVIERFENPIVATNFCRTISLKDDINQEYIYYLWRYLYNKKIFFNYENGTTGIKNLDINSLVENYSISKPHNEIISKFSTVIRHINRIIQYNGTQNTKLKNIRDTLLPKLMSGEIRVPLEEMEESLTEVKGG